MDVLLLEDSPTKVANSARLVEEYGFDALWIQEQKQNPFVHLAVAATTTKKIGLGTAIALAFIRSPMDIAYTSWDLQKLSEGRLLLGLGTEVKGHLERRFSVKWDPPIPKMHEAIDSLRTIWDSWQTGKKLDFKGSFYNFSLMTPYFNPGSCEHPNIPIYVAGINKRMCVLAGELCQGIHVHPVHTAKYLRESIIPNVMEGVAKAGRQRNDVELIIPVFAIVGSNNSERAKSLNFVRSQIAFYASTKAYRPVLETHGWGDIADKLNGLSLKGQWDTMSSLVTEDMLNEIAIEGTWDSLHSQIEERYKDIADRVYIYQPFDNDPGWKQVLQHSN